MLLLALVGVVLRLPVIYWVILTPVFGIISIAEGQTHFVTRTERLGFVFRVALDWCALLLAIYLLYNSGVQGVMNANATSLGMMTLLALGTFVAGVQARVWQICAVGGVLFLVSPRLGLARPITPAVNRWHVRDHRARWCRLVGKPVAPGHYERDCVPRPSR